MDVADLLRSLADEVVNEATQVLGDHRLPHYERAGSDASRQRLHELYDLVIVCIASRDLTPVLAHADRVAQDRFAAGFGVDEVQVAYNVLEEATWRRVVAAVPHDELAEAVGLVGTVFGAGKDALARTYVSLATRTRVPSLDLTALFRGVAAP